jgi:hypothetical protein
MRRVFLDEAGDFNFKPQPNSGSRHLYLVSVSVPEASLLAGELIQLRHGLAFTDEHLQDRVFHATADFQSTRDAVFRLLLQHPFTISATVVDKSGLPDGCRTDVGCYLDTWAKHLRQMSWTDEPTLITAASLFTGGLYRGLKGVRAAMIEAMEAHIPAPAKELSIVPCQADPLLQVADYCCWAIQRKHERDDVRSYEMVAERIVAETRWL